MNLKEVLEYLAEDIWVAGSDGQPRFLRCLNPDGVTNEIGGSSYNSQFSRASRVLWKELGATHYALNWLSLGKTVHLSFARCQDDEGEAEFGATLWLPKPVGDFTVDL